MAAVRRISPSIRNAGASIREYPATEKPAITRFTSPAPIVIHVPTVCGNEAAARTARYTTGGTNGRAYLVVTVS
jgi:hypothetical protein